MEEKMDTFSNPRGWLFKKTEFYSFIIINLLLYYFLLFSPDICSALKVYKEVTISGSNHLLTSVAMLLSCS